MHSVPCWARADTISRTVTFMPPLSPAPGCASGEVWREITAIRRDGFMDIERGNLPRAVKIPGTLPRTWSDRRDLVVEHVRRKVGPIWPHDGAKFFIDSNVREERFVAQRNKHRPNGGHQA